jgi:hypothetical protein
MQASPGGPGGRGRARGCPPRHAGQGSLPLRAILPWGPGWVRGRVGSRGGGSLPPSRRWGPPCPLPLPLGQRHPRCQWSGGGEGGGWLGGTLSFCGDGSSPATWATVGGWGLGIGVGPEYVLAQRAPSGEAGRGGEGPGGGHGGGVSGNETPTRETCRWRHSALSGGREGSGAVAMGGGDVADGGRGEHFLGLVLGGRFLRVG